MPAPVNNNPFTIYQADVGLFTVDSAGLALSQVWIGEGQERLMLDGEFRERVVEYHGRPSAQIYHEAESHTIEIGNVWQHDQSTGVGRMPVLNRNQRYALVIVFFDDEARVWTKLLYSGVTAQPLHLDGVAVEQTLRLKAETLLQVTGIGAKPDLTFGYYGTVVYRNGDESVPLFTYDFSTHTFTVIDPDLLPGRADLDLSTPGEFTISIGGQVALHATSTGVEVRELVASGGTFIDESPRLEFKRGTRTASLSQTGRFAVANAIEQSSAPAPALSDDFETGNPSWLFSISGPTAFAPEFLEVITPGSGILTEGGDVLTTEGGEPLVTEDAPSSAIATEAGDVITTEGGDPIVPE